LDLTLALCVLSLQLQWEDKIYSAEPEQRGALIDYLRSRILVQEGGEGGDPQSSAEYGIDGGAGQYGADPQSSAEYGQEDEQHEVEALLGALSGDERVSALAHFLMLESSIWLT
jgi:hypothetical protein